MVAIAICLAVTTMFSGCEKDKDPVNIDAEQEANIVAFTFAGIDGTATIDKTAHTITAKAKETTDLTAIKAEFTLSKNATAKVNGVTQVSGQTANNFISPVIYKVTSGDGETINNWTVTITKTGGGDNHGFHYTVPENLNAVYTFTQNGMHLWSNTVVKVGVECYALMVTHGDPVVTLETYLKPNTPNAGKWTHYEKRIIEGVYNSGWIAGANRDNWWIWFNDDTFLGFMANWGIYKYCENGEAELVGTEVIAGVLTNKYVGTRYDGAVTFMLWIDPVTKLVLKYDYVNATDTPTLHQVWEVTSWNTTADLGGVDLP
ncbi:MAG: hypothetical protein LBC84_03815 [Prevotellaceae bacterium]|nr:hypothetical protein [Prevotellaceae bacterium]